jgi:hypothetical protein
MWDYPVKQLTERTSFGPDETFDRLLYSGTEFETGFLADLDASFDDIKDPNVPAFGGDVAMLILVRGESSIERVGMESGEDNLADAFPGMDQQVGAAAKGIKRLRARAMLGKIREVAENQPIDKAPSRVEYVTNAMRIFDALADDEIDHFPFPEDDGTNTAFYEGQEVSDILWEDAIEILDAIADESIPPNYPDWQNITLKDFIPDIVGLIDEVFDPFLELLQPGSTFKEQILTLIQSITDKITELEELITKIDEILEAIDRLLSITGFYALYISTPNGVSDLRSRMLNAENVPFSGPAFHAGVALLAGSDARVAFQTLFAPVGGVVP